MRRLCTPHRIAAVITLLLCGCAGPDSAMQVELLTSNTQYAPQSLVQVLFTPPPGIYAKIARLSMTGAPGAQASQVIDALQKKAGSLGANALIVQEHVQTSASQLQFNPVGGQYQTQPGLSVVRVDAIAIRLQPTLPATRASGAE